MTVIKDFRDMRVWQSAHLLVLLTYKLTKQMPKDEQFGLTSQMRRSAVSITSNIAEGFGRFGQKDREHFYVMALGSLYELDSQFQVAKDLTYLHTDAWNEAMELIAKTGKQLSALIRTHRAVLKSSLESQDSSL